jgi:hypothetical protein
MVHKSEPTLLAQVLRVGPHSGSHRVAARASVSVAVPLPVLWSIGHLESAIYAAFGEFTSLYGRNHVHISCFHLQLTLAVVLTSSVVVGVAIGLSPPATGSPSRSRRSRRESRRCSPTPRTGTRPVRSS